MPKIIDNPEQLILTQAREILLKDGIEKLSIRRVAKQSKLSVGTIYNYFANKEELMARIMIEYWEDYFSIIDKVGEEDIGLFDKLKKMYHQFEKFVDTFYDIWVRKNNQPITEYSQQGLERKESFTNKLIDKFKKILDGHFYNQATPLSDIEIPQLAEFIVLNFITLAQMKQLDYTNFEIILRKVIE